MINIVLKLKKIIKNIHFFIHIKVDPPLKESKVVPQTLENEKLSTLLFITK